MLNPALFKLKISQARCPIHTGQVLPLLQDKLRLNEQDSLNYAFYRVNSVSRQQYYGKHKAENYKLALTPVEWDPVEMSWFPAKGFVNKEAAVSPHPFDIDISSQELYDSFGVFTKSTTSLATERKVFEIVQNLFQKAGKLQEFHENYANIDFDRVFQILALKAMDQLPFRLAKEEKEDIYQATLLKFMETGVIEKFDKEKGNLSSFIWGVLNNLLREEIRKYLRTKPEEVLLSNEEGLENIAEDTPHHSLVVDNLAAQEVIENFKNYLYLTFPNKSQYVSERFAEIIDLLVAGFSRKELAEKFGVSKVRILQLYRQLAKHLKVFAEQTQDTDLLQAIQNYTRKKASVKTANWFTDILQYYIDLVDTEERPVLEDVNTVEELEESDRIATTEEDLRLAERVPVGETIRIKRRPVPNFEELTQQVVQDPERSASQATQDIEDYLEEITSADELVEHEGKLIALRIERR